MPSGLIFNLQRFSLHDGPGIRTTVFLKGCALSCSWCHNPESQSASAEVLVLEDRCIRCGACVEACPSDVPVPAAGRALEDALQCEVCGACADACPTEARQVAGREMEAHALAREVLRDRVFFDQSGGGVTFSGGEPLHQAGFLGAALEACREVGLHVTVDTCGLAPPEIRKSNTRASSTTRVTASTPGSGTTAFSAISGLWPRRSGESGCASR